MARFPGEGAEPAQNFDPCEVRECRREALQTPLGAPLRNEALGCTTPAGWLPPFSGADEEQSRTL